MAKALLENVAMHKTGVFRFSENLARGLGELEEIELTFFSSLDKREKMLWQKHLLEMSQLKNIPILNYAHPLKQQMDNLTQKMMETSGVQRFFLKSYRESLRIFMNNYSAMTKDLDQFEIFFSPYHPIPKQIKEKKNIVCFSTIHDLIPLKYPKFFKVDKRRFFDSICKKDRPNQFYVAVSESTKADICHYYSINPEKIFIIPPAPCSQTFFPLEDEKLKLSVQQKFHIDAPYILSLATIEPRKNISFLVDAYIKMISENPSLDHKLVLCGAKGWGFDRLFEKIKDYQDRIIVTGFIQDQDLAPLYSGADFFVYPSLYEGFGLPPVEAMKCRVPVIVSDRSSLPEVVGDAGLYVDPTSLDDLVKQMTLLAKDANLRSQLSEKGYQQALTFNWKKSSQLAKQAFEGALKQVG